jgi:hypothetical protein
MTQVVEQLLSKHEALSSNASTSQNKAKQNKKIKVKKFLGTSGLCLNPNYMGD